MAVASAKKKKGRPRIVEERVVCQALLDAARDCLSHKPYQNISSREIAARAGANAAMINYYFGSKNGLFAELIENMFAELHKALGNFDKGLISSHPSPSRIFAEALERVYCRWDKVLRLFSSEVVSAYNSSLRDAFRQRFATIIYTDVLKFLELMVQEKIYRSDIDLHYMALLLSGIVAMPYHFKEFLPEASGCPANTVSPRQWDTKLNSILDNLLLRPCKVQT